LRELPGVAEIDVTQNTVTCTGEGLDQQKIIEAIEGADPNFKATPAN